MTRRELIQKSLEAISHYCQPLTPRERFQRRVADGLINEAGGVLVTKEEREAGRPLELGSGNEG